MPISRRHVLRLTALTLSALAVGCGTTFDPEAVPESKTRFPRTPIAGDATSTRVVIAFYVADDSAVTLRLWSEDGAIIVDQAVDPSGDGFHKVMIDELVPGAVYGYAVFAGEAPHFEDRSLIGRFRTTPADDALVPVRIALLCCVGQGTVIPDFYMPPGTDHPTVEPFQWEVFTHAVEHDLDALVHLGDQGYFDFVWSLEEGTTEAYLHAWGFYHGGGYRDIYPLASLYATWDDHEATDNGNFDPWDMTAEETTKLANAQDAWFKVVPIDAMTKEERTVWRGFRWGSTLELLLLDCRYEITPDHLMSEAQLAWLIDRIATSPCRFICVATPRPFAKITGNLSEDSTDRWDASPADRDRLAAAIDALDSPRVIFVAGDVHMNYLGRASITGDRQSDLTWEVCCTSGNVNPWAGTLSADQFAYVDASPQLPVLTFDPATGTVDVAFYAADGSLAFQQTLAM